MGKINLCHDARVNKMKKITKNEMIRRLSVVMLLWSIGYLIGMVVCLSAPESSFWILYSISASIPIFGMYYLLLLFRARVN